MKGSGGCIYFLGFIGAVVYYVSSTTGFWLGVLGIFFLLPFSCRPQKEESKPPPPPDIPVYQTLAQDVPIYREYVGQIYGFKDIAIRARVEGYLEEIHFEEGSRTEKGALLYTLESQPFVETVGWRS